MDVHSFRHKLWDLLEVTEDTRTHRTRLDWYDISLAVLIVLNVVAVVLQTVEQIGTAYAGFLHGFELFSVALFTVEYVGRLWACTADPRYSHPVTGRLRYAASFMVIVDLAAFLPFYLPIGTDLRFLRALRLFRLLRVLKLGRYSRSLALLGRVLKRKSSDLLTAVFVLLVLLVIAASAMYFVEYPAQPEAFSSIPASMWWAVSALTTVGYGDIYPVTALGKVAASFISILGLGLFAMPAGILAAGFSEERELAIASENGGVCPTCGKQIER